MPSCWVPFCKTKSSDRNARFHQFPVKEDLRKAWLKVISRKDLDIKSSRAVICSIHFKETDFKQGLKLKRLKKGAVPSIFPGYPSYMIPKPPIKRSVRERPNLEDIPKLKKPRLKKVQVNPLDDISIKYLKITMFETSNLEKLRQNLQTRLSNDGTKVDIKEKVFVDYRKIGDDLNNESFNTAIGNNINEIDSGLNSGKEVTGEKSKEYRELERKLKILYCKNSRLKNVIKKQDAEKLEQTLRYDKLEKEMEMLKKTPHFEELRRIINAVRDEKSTTGNFLLNLIDNFSKNPPKFTKQTLKQCSLLRNASLDGYKFARTLITLPSVLTLNKYQKLDDTEKDGAASNVVRVEGAASNAVRVEGAASNAVRVEGAASNAVRVEGAASNAVRVEGAASNAVRVEGAASNAVRVEGAASNAVRVEGAASNAVRVEGAASNAVRVEGAASNAVRVEGAASNAVRVEGAASNAVRVEGAASNAVRVEGAASNAVRVEGVASNAVRVEGVASNAVRVEGAASNGISKEIKALPPVAVNLNVSEITFSSLQTTADNLL